MFRQTVHTMVFLASVFVASDRLKIMHTGYTPVMRIRRALAVNKIAHNVDNPLVPDQVRSGSCP